MRFDSQRPQLNDLLKLFKLVPPGSIDDKDAQDRLSILMMGCNNYYQYKIGYIFNCDLKFLLSFSTIFGGIFYEIFEKQFEL